MKACLHVLIGYIFGPGLLLAVIALILAGCDEPTIVTTQDPRFTTAILPMISIADRNNLCPSIIHDRKTGAEYLVVQASGAITIIKLEPVPEPKAPTAEKSP